MSLSKLDLFLKNYPIKDGGVDLTYKGLKINKSSQGKSDTVDIIYGYKLEDVQEPFVIYDIFDNTLNKLRRYITHFVTSSVVDVDTLDMFSNRYNGIRFIIDLDIDGKIHKVNEYFKGADDRREFNTDFYILLGKRNEDKLRNFKGSGVLEGFIGATEYDLSFTEGRNGLFHMVDDDSIYLRPDIHFSDVYIIYNAGTADDKFKSIDDLDEETINNLSNVSESTITSDLFSEDIINVLPWDQPLKADFFSERTKGFLEILLFYTIEEDWAFKGTIPPYVEIHNEMDVLLDRHADSFCRPSMDSFYFEGNKVKGLTSYWADTSYDAHKYYWISLTLDYIISQRGTTVQP